MALGLGLGAQRLRCEEAGAGGPGGEGQDGAAGQARGSARKDGSLHGRSAS